MKKYIIWILCVDIVVILSATFIFGIQYVDTATYVDQIQNYRHFEFSSGNQWDEFRAFKPLIGSVGMLIPFVAPTALILGLNALFLFGLSIVLLYFFSELGFSPRQSFIGALWIVAGYPSIAFSFAGGTDISGWFFCIATILAVLAAARERKERYLLLASALGFLGATAKETGVLGLIFGGVYLLLHITEWGFARTAKKIALLGLPALVLEGVLFYLFSLSGVPTFGGWLQTNETLYANVHTLTFFVGAEVSTFNIFWLFAGLGVYALLRKKIPITGERAYQLIALCIASLPVIEWPFFTDRILYIEFIFVIPLALYGTQYLLTYFPTQRGPRYVLYALPILCAIFFVHIGGHDGMYRLLHEAAHALHS